MSATKYYNVFVVLTFLNGIASGGLMKGYICRRFCLILPMLLFVSVFAFALIALVPVDPAEVALRVNEIVPTPEAVNLMRTELGLDKSFIHRYFDWLGKAVQLDFGNSYINNRSVSNEILRCLPYTLELAAVSMFIVLGVSIPLGILAAMVRNKFMNGLIRVLVFVGTAIPNYWLGLLLIWLFSIKLGLLPTGGSGNWTHLLLPALALSLTYISTYVRLLRANVLENMQEMYVLYARARGFSEKRILIKHVLRNSLQTSITAFGMSVPQLLAGTVIIENIFAWPGVGRLCISSIFNRDYPVIQAYIFLMANMFIICNLAVDIIQRWLDPRQRDRSAI